MSANTYAETIGGLDEVIARCSADGDRAGYFAAMYVAVTRTVQARADGHGFRDANRMERFVTTFAGRYLSAYESWRSGGDVARCWRGPSTPRRAGARSSSSTCCWA